MEENIVEKKSNSNGQQIAGAIIIAGVLIGGAILLKGNNVPNSTDDLEKTPLIKISAEDKIQGNPKAKVALVVYEDYQCSFCAAIGGFKSSSSRIASLKQRDPSWTPFLPEVITNYVDKGSVQLIYRDWAFLGPESARAAEGARCAGDQGKFLEYHDYLYNHQNGTNEGAFSDLNLKSFAKEINLNTSTFNKCLDENKHSEAVAKSRDEGTKLGVTGTPKGFIVKNGKILDIIDGAEPFSIVKQKIDSALK